MPAAIDPVKVDHYFVEELCLLNSDENYFRGLNYNDIDTLHPYLIRYLIMYFDNDYDLGTIWNSYFDDFVSGHRSYRPPNGGEDIFRSEKEACNCLGISPARLKKMNQQELTRCYRKLAKETHPDRGGDKGKFIEVREAYELLIKKKR